MSGTRIWDATCYIAEDDSLSHSSSDAHVLLVDGDTLRLATNKTPASNDPGYPGEICKDANYIYVCVATDSWKRVALGTY